MYVVDTNVLSELRRREPNPAVVEWVEGADSVALYTTVINLYEIKRGILSVPSRDTGQISALETWLDRILDWFDGKVLPLTADSAIGAAEAQKRTSIELRDCMIGAIANEHEMTVVTRNIKHMSRVCDSVIDPWR